MLRSTKQTRLSYHNLYSDKCHIIYGVLRYIHLIYGLPYLSWSCELNQPFDKVTLGDILFLW